METVKLTINGQEMAAPKGELLIEACEMNGVYLPRFCHHRGLTETVAREDTVRSLQDAVFGIHCDRFDNNRRTVKSRI